MEQHNRDKLFLSFDENDESSLEMVNAAEVYFNSWNIDPIIIKKHTGINDPTEAVFDGLERANYFLQIMTAKQRSYWMEKEWNHIIGRAHAAKCSVFLFSKDGIDIDRDTRDVHHAKLGDEEAIQTQITKILKHRKDKESIGNCFLPKCFRNDQKAKLEFKDIDELLDFIQNFKDVYGRGLIRIYPEKKDIADPIKRKLSALQPGDEVRMLGITLKSIVAPDGNDSVGYHLGEALTHNANVKVRMLLLDRNCDAAKERAGIEDRGVSYESTLLLTDSNKVRQHVADSSHKDRFSIVDYKTPYCGMVLFKDEVFVEMYHIGDHLSKRELCGKVPILQIRKGYDLYEYFDSHFKNVWNINCKENDRIDAFHDIQTNIARGGTF